MELFSIRIQRTFQLVSTGMVLRNIIFDTQILIKRDRGVDPVRIIVIASGKHASEQQASIKEILSHII